MSPFKKGVGPALGKIPSGLFIVTAGSGDNSSGFLASWVQQTSFEPPLVTVAVKEGRGIEIFLEQKLPFVINILGEKNRNLMKHFLQGFAPDENPFENLNTFSGITGTPVLEDVLSYLECEYRESHKIGDHVLYVGEVVNGALQTKEDEPLVHIRKNGFNY